MGIDPARTAADPPVTVCEFNDPSPAQLHAWDALVHATPGTDVTQLSHWASVRGLVGYRPTYLFAYRGARLVGGALVLRRRLFGVLGVGYLPYGPLLPEPAQDRDMVRDVLVDALVEMSTRPQMLVVQPPEHSQDVSDALLERGFRPSRAGIAPGGSYRLDLTADLDQIRAGFSRRLRSWTNRWAAKGVSVRVGDERDLPLLVELISRSGSRQGFAPPSLEYVRTMYTSLAPSGNAALFVGEVHGVPISADMVTTCGDMVRGRLGGFDASGEAGKLSVPAAVRWEIIQWAKSEGYRWLDFGGLPEQMLHDMIDLGLRCSDEWPSAQRAKLAFNGTPFRYPTAVEVIHPAVARLAYDAMTGTGPGNRALRAVEVRLRGTAGRRRTG